MGLSTILSFLSVPAIAAVVKSNEPKKPELPKFKPRFWFQGDRLDARPVAWSLRNHPEEWVWKSEPYTIEHKPSQHSFRVSCYGGYSLRDADCTCTSENGYGYFQSFQQLTFHRAFKSWLLTQPAKINADQFASHFIRSEHK